MSSKPRDPMPDYLQNALEDVYVIDGPYWQGPSIHGLDGLRNAILLLVKERDDARTERDDALKNLEVIRNTSHPSVEGLV